MRGDSHRLNGDSALVGTGTGRCPVRAPVAGKRPSDHFLMIVQPGDITIHYTATSTTGSGALATLFVLILGMCISKLGLMQTKKTLCMEVDLTHLILRLHNHIRSLGTCNQHQTTQIYQHPTTFSTFPVLEGRLQPRIHAKRRFRRSA